MSRSRSREVHERAESAAAGSHGKWVVHLPQGAGAPLRVWVNGVEQSEGDDFVLRARRLEFEKPLAKEGRIGFFRWALIFFGIAGTYRKNDSVDVQYTSANGQVRLVTGLDIESPD
jgi:hypothetical protein